MLTHTRAWWESGGVASLRRREAAPAPTRSRWPLVIFLQTDTGKSIPTHWPLVPGRDQLPTGKGQTVSRHE